MSQQRTDSRISSPFNVGDYLCHPKLGMGVVLEVDTSAPVADRITILYLGGLMKFMVGSRSFKAWRRVKVG